jgi:polyisoprenoid-binding protein YceI
MLRYNLLMAIVLFFAGNALFANEYHVDKKQTNSVKFVSKATMESFEGNTEKIDGYIVLQDAPNLYQAELYFEVDLNSVDTGIGLRNRHMREEYLYTDKYPLTSFKGKITNVKKITDTQYDVTVTGEMDLHGVKKTRMINGTIDFTSKGININTEFIVKLTDHNIEVPSLMFMRINEDIQLVLDFNLKKVK